MGDVRNSVDTARAYLITAETSEPSQVMQVRVQLIMFTFSVRYKFSHLHYSKV